MSVLVLSVLVLRFTMRPVSSMLTRTGIASRILSVSPVLK